MRRTVLRIIAVAGVSLAAALLFSFAVVAQDDRQQAQPSGGDQAAPADQSRHAKPTKLAGIKVDPADIPDPEKDGKPYTSSKYDFQVLLPNEWRGIEVKLKDQKFFAQREFGDDTVEFNVSIMDSFSTQHAFSDYIFDQRKEIENLSDDAVVMNNADLQSEAPSLKIHLIDYKFTHETLGKMICARVFYLSSTTDRLYTVNFSSKDALFKDAGEDMAKILRTFKVGI